MLAIDLFCGLGGWAEGFLAEGYDVIGFDIERHCYPFFGQQNFADLSGVKAPGNDTFKKNGKPCNRLIDPRYGSGIKAQSRGEIVGFSEYPGQLVLQDVLTLHGSQFRNASVIVASPPCQAYSYRAMPWKRAKALPPPTNELFEACFRIQREASEAAGRYIPLVVENVRGAEKWVGAARWHFGSYYLWGDVPPLMPIPGRVQKFNPDGTQHGQGPWFKIADSVNRGGRKVPGFRFLREGENASNGTDDRRNDAGGNLDSVLVSAGSDEGRVQEVSAVLSGDVRDTFGWSKASPLRNNNSKSDSRKQASAEIAKIPFPLAQHIARVFKPC